MVLRRCLLGVESEAAEASRGDGCCGVVRFWLLGGRNGGWPPCCLFAKHGWVSTGVLVHFSGHCLLRGGNWPLSRQNLGMGSGCSWLRGDSCGYCRGNGTGKFPGNLRPDSQPVVSHIPELGQCEIVL